MIFQIRNNTHYNLRYDPTFLTELIHIVFNSNESASYLGHTIWEEIPNDFKMVNSLVRFKKEIRKWKSVNCPCIICKNSVPNLDFV